MTPAEAMQVRPASVNSQLTQYIPLPPIVSTVRERPIAHRHQSKCGNFPGRYMFTAGAASWTFLIASTYHYPVATAGSVQPDGRKRVTMSSRDASDLRGGSTFEIWWSC